MISFEMMCSDSQYKNIKVFHWQHFGINSIFINHIIKSYRPWGMKWMHWFKVKRYASKLKYHLCKTRFIEVTKICCWNNLKIAVKKHEHLLQIFLLRIVKSHLTLRHILFLSWQHKLYEVGLNVIIFVIRFVPCLRSWRCISTCQPMKPVTCKKQYSI